MTTKRLEFDVVIPIGPSDICILSNQLINTKSNIIGFRYIYLICFDINNVKRAVQNNHNDVIFIDEQIFPFTIEDVASYLGNSKRNGWYLQQLLKLHAGIVIPDISDKYLVIDADTFFLKPTTFSTPDGALLYNFGTEYHQPYFEHMKRLHFSFQKQTPYSGICHHMMFQTQIIVEMFHMVESLHNKPFWRVFLENIDKCHIPFSGTSEYEIYFNFIIQTGRQIQIRLLKWNNVQYNPIEDKNSDDFVYVSWHSYDRNF